MATKLTELCYKLEEITDCDEIKFGNTVGFNMMLDRAFIIEKNNALYKFIRANDDEALLKLGERVLGAYNEIISESMDHKENTPWIMPYPPSGKIKLTFDKFIDVRLTKKSEQTKYIKSILREMMSEA